MNQHDRPPSEDELRAMAWVDGELGPDEARAFEARMAREPALAREVTELRALELLARQMAPPEPADHEWERLAHEPLHREGTRLATGLILGGLTAAWIAMLWFLATAEDLELLPKTLLLAVLGGLTLLFLLVLRARLRTLPYDPYTKVKR